MRITLRGLPSIYGRAEEPAPVESLFDSGYSIFDTVLEKIQATIGSRRPESGGALLGSYGNSLIVDFLFDDAGETTGSTYVPSVDLSERVRGQERERNLQFKGVVHSHPGSFDRPSGPDEHSFGAGLDANPELPRYLAPIVTLGHGDPAPNKLEFDGIWVSFYVATRRSTGSLRVSPCLPKVIHFARDVRELAKNLVLKDPIFFPTDSNDMYSVSAELILSDNSSLVLAASGSYPELPPLALYFNSRSGETRQLHLRWNVLTEPDLRLAEALGDARFLEGGKPSRVAYGRGGSVLTTHRSSASALGLDPVVAGESLTDYIGKVSEGLFARSRGVLTDRMTSAHVLIAGCGSVGSYVAEHFVRCGAGEVTLLDPDTVDFANLSRANFIASDVGRPKIEALAERLLSISPSLRVNLMQKTLQDIGEVEFTRLIESCSLVISALDDRRAQLQINQWAYWFKKPAVYIGVFAKAQAGEVAIVDAPSPCFACATVFREVIPVAEQGTHDYGVGRLVSEVALGVDIQSISSIGVRLGLSSLMKGAGTSIEDFAARALVDNQYAIFAVTKDFSLVNEILRDAPAQYGHRSIWLTVKKLENCNICGPNPGKPMIDRAPDLDELRNAILLAQITSDLPPENG